VTQPAQPPPLDGLLVVDMTDSWGELAGRTLADLGATVIKVEPPNGVDSRRRAPFDERSGHEGESLYWAAVGRGKHSLEVDLDAPDQAMQLRTLIAAADIFIESSRPGQARELGLGYEELSATNPGLVYASITPFGQDGPMAGAASSELITEAAGGLVSLQGDGDRPNIPVGYPQSAFHAGVQAAADICIALHERQRSGLGQYLDVAVQPAMVWTLMNATGWPPNAHQDPIGECEARGGAPREPVPGVSVPRLFACKDGWVTLTIAIGRIGARSMARVMSWMEELGELPPALQHVDWANWGVDVNEGRLEASKVIAAIEEIKRFFLTKTKLELQTFGMKSEILLAAIYDAKDIHADPHHAAREYFETAGGRVHPGPWVRFSRTPLAVLDGAEPLGASQGLLAMSRIKSNGVAPKEPRELSFAGLRIADFAWVGVGPIISKALADHGATVVHVESSTAPDVLRLGPPFKDNVAGIDNSQFMANFNSSKLGIAANLNTEGGRAIARKLVAWADVVVESYTPGTMAKWGLDYGTISQGRPDLVMLSTCLRGQTGPERSYTGFGGQGAAIAGIHGLTGWPDRGPYGPWGAYTDFINPRYGVAALTSALMHRARTGQGQYLDLSQVEAGIHFIEPVILDYTTNGRVWGPQGHDSLYACPHGVFATAGAQRYLAIAVETAEQWAGLRSLAPLDEFGDSKFDDLDVRRAAKETIEARVREWCRGQDGFELAERLRSAGVPAHMVLRPSDLYADAQLSHRQFFVTLNHTNMGPTPYDGHVTKFSETPGVLSKAAPCLGEDTQMVLREFLGYSDEAIAELAAAGALT
jgi:crotonobetainyl-CoA:carnitine CoA-transferase CaiB-like acyl-CoA transferase